MRTLPLTSSALQVARSAARDENSRVFCCPDLEAHLAEALLPLTYPEQ